MFIGKSNPKDLGLKAVIKESICRKQRNEFWVISPKMGRTICDNQNYGIRNI